MEDEILLLKNKIKELEQIIKDNNLTIKDGYDRCDECNTILNYLCKCCDNNICINCNYLRDNDYLKCIKYRYGYICYECKDHKTHEIKPYTCSECREIKCIECDYFTRKFANRITCNICMKRNHSNK